jgi:hypothetical protein
MKTGTKEPGAKSKKLSTAPNGANIEYKQTENNQ